jgi:(p)ppGpp synthase/HD superfamily hydrolase
MQKLADGQVTWTELRKQFGSKVANAIAKIRKLNTEFGSEMELLDAKDRATMLKVETKRQNGLTEIAHDLAQDLQAEMWRHQNKMEAISNKGVVAEQRQSIQSGLRAKRQELLNRATVGSSLGIQDKIPVAIAQSTTSNSVSATGTPRGFGGWLANLINFNH